jgi:hypothetical protein
MQAGRLRYIQIVHCGVTEDISVVASVVCGYGWKTIYHLGTKLVRWTTGQAATFGH